MLLCSVPFVFLSVEFFGGGGVAYADFKFHAVLL